eukprot:GGOE01029031.1.p1 GENE.GGOE01029031.1~~GGOE01029031.1.p1  ORF type:complete len:438 (-),score=79.83 GGOE01029031.1:192-1397(-)
MVPENQTLSTTPAASLPHKKFAWLLQAGTLPKKRPVHPTAERDVIWLTYRDASGDVYYPRSTYTQGRNRLLDEAISRAVRMPNGGYLYYIFVDGDVKLTRRLNAEFQYRPRLPSNPYNCFQAFLLEWEPAVGSVAFGWTRKRREGVSTFQNVDALLQAQHRETLSFGLPNMDLDCHSAFYQQHVMNFINAMLYNTRRVQLNAVVAKNERHGHNPTYLRVERWHDCRCFMKNALLQNSSLHRTFVASALPMLTTGLGRRRGNVSYIVPLQFISMHFNVTHPLVQRSLQFRARHDVQQLLHTAARLQPGTFAPDPRACFPRGKEVDNLCFTGSCESTALLRCPQLWHTLAPWARTNQEDDPDKSMMTHISNHSSPRHSTNESINESMNQSVHLSIRPINHSSN